MKKHFIAAAVILMAGAVRAQSGQYKILKTFQAGGDGKWDYIALNPVTNQLYASHGTQVNILDKNTGDSTGVIPNTTGVHGIAFAEKFKKGYTSNGKLNTVTVFDIKTNKVLGEIKTGANPDAIMYEPFSGKIITCNGGSKNLSLIDPATDKVVATIELGGRPETAVSDEKGNIYINLEDKSQITKVDLRQQKVTATWPLGKGEAPTGLAIDLHTRRLFAGCDNKLLVIMDADNGKVIADLPIGDGCDGVAFDAAEKNIYASNGEGTLSVIHEAGADKYQPVATVATHKGAKTLTVDPSTHHIYLPFAERNGSTVVPGTFRVLEVGR